MRRRFCFVGIILLPLMSADLGAAQDLRIMVVISNNAHSIWGGNDLFNDVKDGIINVMEQANLPTPSFHKYVTYPQLVESALTPNAAMNISLSPSYLTARNDATADIVLFVLSDINAPDSQDCGGARGIPARKIDLVADLVSTHHIQNANYRFAKDQAKQMLAYAKEHGQITLWLVLNYPYNVDTENMTPQELSTQEAEVSQGFGELLGPLLSSGDAWHPPSGVFIRGPGCTVRASSKGLKRLLNDQRLFQITTFD